jgi:hypothetical protein
VKDHLAFKEMKKHSFLIANNK